MTACKYTVEDAVLEVFASTSNGQRKKLLRIFSGLVDNAYQPGDRIQREDVGRPLQLKRFGDWIVTYWSEHLGNLVHIIAIEDLRA